MDSSDKIEHKASFKLLHYCFEDFRIYLFVNVYSVFWLVLTKSYTNSNLIKNAF